MTPEKNDTETDYLYTPLSKMENGRQDEPQDAALIETGITLIRRGVGEDPSNSSPLSRKRSGQGRGEKRRDSKQNNEGTDYPHRGRLRGCWKGIVVLIGFIFIALGIIALTIEFIHLVKPCEKCKPCECAPNDCHQEIKETQGSPWHQLYVSCDARPLYDDTRVESFFSSDNQYREYWMPIAISTPTFLVVEVGIAQPDNFYLQLYDLSEGVEFHPGESVPLAKQDGGRYMFVIDHAGNYGFSAALYSHPQEAQPVAYSYKLTHHELCIMYGNITPDTSKGIPVFDIPGGNSIIRSTNPIAQNTSIRAIGYIYTKGQWWYQVLYPGETGIGWIPAVNLRTSKDTSEGDISPACRAIYNFYIE